MPIVQKAPVQHRIKSAVQHLDVCVLELDPMVDRKPFQKISEELRDALRDLEDEVMKVTDAASRL